VTLQLDARRAAMLREMGLRLLPPLRAPQPEPEPEPEAVAATAGSSAAGRSPPVRGSAEAQAAAVPADAVVSPAGRSDLDTLGWDELQAAAQAFATRDGAGRRLVFGVGPRRADWMVIGEAPGAAEEEQGEPFAGQAGKLLDNMLRAMRLERDRDVYRTNLLKCRPPGDRNPEPDELAQWEPYLRREVALVQPRLILVMGRFVVPRLLQTQEPIGRLRGRLHQYQGVPVVVTYHPTYLLRNRPDKAKAWADLCLAQASIAGAQDPASGR
jgi:DNA polymerase